MVNIIRSKQNIANGQSLLPLGFFDKYQVSLGALRIPLPI